MSLLRSGMAPSSLPWAYLGYPGEYPGGFNKPYGIARDREGNIYVSDTYNYRIQIFKPVK